MTVTFAHTLTLPHFLKCMCTNFARGKTHTSIFVRLLQTRCLYTAVYTLLSTTPKPQDSKLYRTRKCNTFVFRTGQCEQLLRGVRGNAPFYNHTSYVNSLKITQTHTQHKHGLVLRIINTRYTQIQKPPHTTRLLTHTHTQIHGGTQENKMWRWRGQLLGLMYERRESRRRTYTQQLLVHTKRT